MPLTDLACRTAKPSGKLRKLSDMGGLQLWIQPRGTKLWRYAYRFGGKQRLIAFGIYPAVTLAQARVKRDEAKTILEEGRDPSAERKLVHLRSEAPGDTFGLIANEYLAKLRREGRAETTLTKVGWLLDFARAELGAVAVSAIRPADVLAVLQKVERRGRHETARRLRSTIGAVFRYAIATARAEVDPTAPLAGALTTPMVKPRAAITDPVGLGALLRAIDGFDGQETTLVALRLMALLFPRPGELRTATWEEFDLDAALWTIPKLHMKMRRAHRVPLAPQAITVLRDLREVTGRCPLVLPSVRSAQRPISDNTMNAALRRLGYAKDEMTAHGFRATASTLLNESGLWNPDAIERQLAHVENDDVRRAYARGEHWDERVRMMHWWADHLDTLRNSSTASRPQRPLRSGATLNSELHKT
jgi:integrase